MKVKVILKNNFLPALCLWVILSVVSACNKKEGLDFSPPAENTKPFTFSISSNNGTNRYVLDKYSATISQDGDVKTAYNFIMKGNDNTGVYKIIITGKISRSANYTSSHKVHKIEFNIAFENQATFYKDCNNAYVVIEEGSNTRGEFIKFNSSSGSGMECITSTLDGNRRMNLTSYSFHCDDMIFYLQN